MVRFRNVEDERRFTRLKADVLVSLTRCGVPAEAVTEVLRSLGKIESLAHLEGVRQGLAMAAIVDIADASGELRFEQNPHALKAFQLHSMIYGSADTPLRSHEVDLLRRAGLDETTLAASWLDDKPLRFAPMTLQEWLGQEAQAAPMIRVTADRPPVPVTQAGAEDDSDLGEILASPAGDAPEVDDARGAAESPEFCDLVREAIQSLQKSGWSPDSWTKLIWDLHLHMKVDAGFLDIQLSTHVGRAVLDQCGLFGLAPGASITLRELVSGADEGPLAAPLPDDPD